MKRHEEVLSADKLPPISECRTFYRTRRRRRPRFRFADLVTYPVHTLKEKFDDLGGYDPMDILAEEIALDFGRSVVSLRYWTGSNLFFACSGLIIGWNGSCATILTSAFLVPCDPTPEDKIMFSMNTMEDLEGEKIELLSDRQFNIALIRLKLKTEPYVAKLEVPGWPCSGEHVLSVGRHRNSDLMATRGVILSKCKRLNCMLSSCRITKTGIGGPLVSIRTKRVIGINFYDKKDTPFVPAEILLRCLKQLDTYRIVFQPDLGVSLMDLADLELFELDKLQQQYANIHGVRVAYVAKDSPAESAEIMRGDIISFLDGYKVHSALQFTALLLDLGDKFMEMGLRDSEYKVKIYLRSKGMSRTVCLNNLQHEAFSGCSQFAERWQLPKESIVRMQGRTVLPS